MSFDAESLGLRSSALPLLRDLIHDHTGLSYDDGRLELLADRLAPLVAERRFHCFLDYFFFLKYDENAAGEWRRIADALSVQETYFYREIDQIRAAIDIVLPQLVARYSGQPLPIWSVPCASGEEPLTIAMLLEEGGWFDRACIELNAGDVSPAALERARLGCYRPRSFRSLPAGLRDKYFDREAETWRVKPSLHQRVHTWRTINLMSDADLQVIASAPLIFCRNVFIYFSDRAIRRVVNTLADSMPSPGFLCLATSESLLRITDRFELEQIGGAFMYVKRATPRRGPQS